MYVKEIGIKNFRLLQDVNLSLEQQTTVLVGRNNSGKTSLIELFRRLWSDRSPTFRLEDFSLGTQEQFWIAFKRKQRGDDKPNIRRVLPYIEVKLTIEYEEISGILADFTIDLDEDCTTALVIIRYELRDGKVEALFENIQIDNEEAESRQKEVFFKEIKERVEKLFKVNLLAVDPNDPTSQKPLESAKLKTLIHSGFIFAQRGLDDTTHKNRNTLGQVLEVLFNTAMLESAEPSDQDIVKEIEATVQNIQGDINENFSKQLKSLLPSLKRLGYPGLKDQNLQTETTLDASRLLKDHTTIHYGGISGVNLPESYNGLGARNLILILFNLLGFFKDYRAAEVAPSIHLIFLEEPEVHLHPQMQTVFIRKLQEIADAFAKDYNNGQLWPVQFIVSTHSSYLANEAPFDAIRYFLAKENDPINRIFTTEIKDLKQGLSDTSPDNREFLHQYMTLTRCDLMFADKAILIEGTSERLLLPKIIKEIDKSFSDEERFSSQYVSILEVGGAYAHIFLDLLKFLEVPALIITDLDSINDDRKACKVSEGSQTSNNCIKHWFDDREITPTDLIRKSEQDKIKDTLRIAYQVPEAEGQPCGRTLEDALMLANPDLFDLTGDSASDKEQCAWEKMKSVKKSAFALKYAIEETDWNVPQYISEGLSWLATVTNASEVAELTPDRKLLNEKSLVNESG